MQGWKNTTTEIKSLRNNAHLQGANGEKAKSPIKLFYTSNMPIMLLSALLGTIYISSQTLFDRYKSNVLVRLLGVWEVVEGRSRPTWGVAYLVSPPQSLAEIIAEPFKAVVYITFMLSMCAVLARTWIEVSGSGPEPMLREMETNPQINGYPSDPMWPRNAAKDATRRESARGKDAFREKIKTAAALGGMCVGALTIGADLLGALGSGTGILMAVTIIYDMLEKVAPELQLEMKKNE